MSYTKATIRYHQDAANLGVPYDDAEILRRAATTLHRWFELECGEGNDYASWAIERDETTDKPYKCVYPHQGKMRRYPVPDREKGARRRIQAAADRHSLSITIQCDPRGWPLTLTAADGRTLCPPPRGSF